MSVLGIDFGSLQSVLAVARNRGVDVICNEVSNRATPSMVAFTGERRFLGEAAKNQEVTNLKGTVSLLPRLLGRRIDDPELQGVERAHINADLCEVDGQVGVRVPYLGKMHEFSATQLAAMYLGKLRDMAVNETKGPVVDVVISVPGWFADVQKRALLDACKIVGLNPLRLINNTTASALNYGLTKTDLPEKEGEARNVAIVDVGYSTTSIIIVSYMKGKLVVRSAAHNRNLGGYNFDEVLVGHLVARFRGKYKVDISSNPKALLRLRVACDKLKKVLSANARSVVNVESIMNDIDVNATVTREEFEQLAQGVLAQIEPLVGSALKQANLAVTSIHSVELVGGSTRIPAIKELLSRLFQKELSYTLNQDEAVARGCALQCAMLSPAFRVREFYMQDANNYAVKFVWGAQAEMEVFSAPGPAPSLKVLTFYQRQEFSIQAQYVNLDELPPSQPPQIAKFTVKNVTPTENGDPSTVKVRARLNLHGVVTVESAHREMDAMEQVPVKVKVQVPKATKGEDTQLPGGSAGKQEEGDGQQGNGRDNGGKDNGSASRSPEEQMEEREEVRYELKKVTRKTELLVQMECAAVLSDEKIRSMRQQEAEMVKCDRYILEKEEQRNTLEEYIYEMRGKMEMEYSEYVLPDEKDAFVAELDRMEDWLYAEEGESAGRDVYAQKLDELKNQASYCLRNYRPPAPEVEVTAGGNGNGGGASADTPMAEPAAEQVQLATEHAADEVNAENINADVD